jgi:predicted chitinase
MNNDYAGNKLEVEIDGKIFLTYRKSSFFDLQMYYATIRIVLPIPYAQNNYKLTVRLEESVSKKIIDQRSINVKVTTEGKVNEVGKVSEIGNESKNQPPIKNIPIESITLEQLISIGISKNKATEYITDLNKTFQDYNINTNLRIIHFLAQVIHESGRFKYTAEIGVTDAKYGGYKGRGLMQITGLGNYTKYEDYESEDFTSSLENKIKLEKPPYSIRSAGWFWSIESELIDDSEKNDFIYITRLINGGFNGYNDRLAYFKKGISVLMKDVSLTTDFNFAESKAYNDKRASFAWGLWHDIDLNKKGCTKDKTKAIEGYKRFLELVSENFSDTNWYGIKTITEFANLKYIKGKKSYIKVIEAAKQRLQKLSGK